MSKVGHKTRGRFYVRFLMVIIFILIFSCLFLPTAQAQKQEEKAVAAPLSTVTTKNEDDKEQESSGQPEKVKVGVYLTSLYDLDFPDNSFKTEFWIWFNYFNDSLTPMESMEIVNGKESEFILPSTEKKGGINWGAQKCRATIKKEWNIENFPFDKQELDIKIEEAIENSEFLIYTEDRENSGIDKNIKLVGWKITDFQVNAGITDYETTYGDPTLKGKSSYTHFMISIFLQREGWGLFFKLFLGVYIAFAIALLVFFIEPDEIDSRFGLSVGSLFAAVANKYIVDSILPETISLTLADKVHLLSFFFILIIFMACVIAVNLHNREKKDLAKRIDRIIFWICLIAYTGLNVSLIVMTI